MESGTQVWQVFKEFLEIAQYKKFVYGFQVVCIKIRLSLNPNIGNSREVHLQMRWGSCCRESGYLFSSCSEAAEAERETTEPLLFLQKQKQHSFVPTTTSQTLK